MPTGIYKHKKNQGFQKCNKHGKKFGNGYVSKHIRENHWNWKGGITPENRIIRTSIEFRLWRESVFARDNWACQKCGKRGEKIHAHHIQNFAQFPELRFAIDNGVTFCQDCHQQFHKIYKDNN